MPRTSSTRRLVKRAFKRKSSYRPRSGTTTRAPGVFRPIGGTPAEIKYFDRNYDAAITTQTPFNIPTPDGTRDFFRIGVGPSGSGARIGRQVNVLYIQIQMMIAGAQIHTNAPESLPQAIHYWLAQSDSGPPANSNDIIYYPSIDTTRNPDLRHVAGPLRNIGQMASHRILAESTVTIGATNGYPANQDYAQDKSAPQYRFIFHRFPGRGLPVRWVADIATEPNYNGFTFHCESSCYYTNPGHIYKIPHLYVALRVAYTDA